MSLWSDGLVRGCRGHRPLVVLERDRLIVEYFEQHREELILQLRWDNEVMRKELAEAALTMAAGA